MKSMVINTPGMEDAEVTQIMQDGVLPPVVDVYNPEVLSESNDMTLEEVTEAAEAMCAELAKLVGITDDIRVVIDGNTTRVKFRRVRGGYELSCGLKAFIAPKYQVIARFMHELIHVYNDINFIVDTCGNGAYHTEIFNNAAQALGLFTTWSRSYGFAGKVELKESTVAAFNPILQEGIDAMFLPEDTAILHKPAKAARAKGKGGFQAKIYKIVCEACGTVLYVQKDHLVTEADFIAQESAPKPVRKAKPVVDIEDDLDTVDDDFEDDDDILN